MLFRPFRNGRNITATFKQQPLRFIFILAFPRTHPNEGPFALQLFPFQDEMQFALLQRAERFAALTSGEVAAIEFAPLRIPLCFRSTFLLNDTISAAGPT